MTKLATSANMRIVYEVRKILREDAEKWDDLAKQRTYERLLEIESLKIVTELLDVLQSDDSASSKISQCADILMLPVDDEGEGEDDDDDVQLGGRTPVSTKPRT
jgi:hypothetical protein